MKTYVPSSTKRCAVANPIPLLPPVTRAIFPSSFFILLSSLFLFSYRLVQIRLPVDTNVNRFCTDKYGNKKSETLRGRPRAFDAEKALEAAMQVFWRNGYEGTSLSDLTAAMGINRPSLYAAFGNKETVFRKVVERYVNRMTGYVSEALNQPTGRGAVESLLVGAVNLMTCPNNPPGCLLVQGALACGTDATSIRNELILQRIASDATREELLQVTRIALHAWPGVV